MSKKRGFTIVEALVVIGIISVLASLTYVYMAPAREAARQTVCKAQIKSIYGVLQLYAADHDSGQYPELHGLTYAFQPGLNPWHYLSRYGFTKEFLFCPSSSAAMRDKLASTYILGVVFSPVGPDGKMSEGRKRLISLEAQYGILMPLTTCHVHDELFYAPQERHIALHLASPFLIRSRLDGSIKAGRVMGPRTFFLTEYSHQTRR